LWSDNSENGDELTESGEHGGNSPDGKKSLSEQHRRAFNVSAFQCVYDGNTAIFPEDGVKGSHCLTDEKYNKIVKALKNWEQEVRIKEIQHRKDFKRGYYWNQRFTVVKSTLPSGEIVWNLFRKDADGVATHLWLPMSKIFDAIKDAHESQLAHLKSSPTHKAIQKNMETLHWTTVNHLLGSVLFV
jgi:hypothetical protein